MKSFSVLPLTFHSNQTTNSHRPKPLFAWGWLSIALCVSAGLSAFGQASAPSISWSTSVNARLFAVDSADNTYAVTTNGTVVTINSSGTVVSSNALTHLLGFAQRDSTGNFYLFGSFDGTNDFGGTTVVGGYIDNIDYYPARWVSGWPTVYLAKYSSAGSLLWVTNFGVSDVINIASDLVINSDDTATVSYFAAPKQTIVAQYSSSGQLNWLNNLALANSSLQFGELRLTALSTTNYAFLDFNVSVENIALGTFDSSGNVSMIGGGAVFFGAGAAYAKPVLSTNGSGFVAGLIGRNAAAPPILELYQNFTLTASNAPAGTEPWTLASDGSGGVYVSGLSGNFAEYDSGANLLWATNYGSPVDVMLTDSSGHSFVSLDNGSVARLNTGGTPAPPLPAPILAWTASVNGRLFAVDSSDNSYAITTNGAVIKVNSSGTPLQTNMLTHLPGFAQRDSSGNFYVCGSFDGTNDFGGTSAVGGLIDIFSHPPRWTPGFPTIYLAKYSGAGSLLWVTNFGAQSYINVAGDLVMNPDDSVTLTYSISAPPGLSSFIAQFTSSGALGWQQDFSYSGEFRMDDVPLRIASTSSTNGIYLDYSLSSYLGMGTYDSSGHISNDTYTNQLFPAFWINGSLAGICGKPVLGTNGTQFVIGLTQNKSSGSPVITTYQNGAFKLSALIPGTEPWPLAGDGSGNVYLSALNGYFAKYDSSANVMWATNYGSPVDVLITDAAGNNFISLNNGTLAELAAPPALAMIASKSGLVFTWPAVGSNLTLQVSTSLSSGWINVSAPTKIVGNQCVVSNSNPTTGSAVFFRLK